MVNKFVSSDFSSENNYFLSNSMPSRGKGEATRLANCCWCVSSTSFFLARQDQSQINREKYSSPNYFSILSRVSMELGTNNKQVTTTMDADLN